MSRLIDVDTVAAGEFICLVGEEELWVDALGVTVADVAVAEVRQAWFGHRCAGGEGAPVVWWGKVVDRPVCPRCQRRSGHGWVAVDRSLLLDVAAFGADRDDDGEVTAGFDDAVAWLGSLSATPADRD